MKDLIILNEVAPVIDCNFEEVKNDLSIRLGDYKKLVVTEDSLTFCKNEQKHLAGLRKKIEDYRKKTKKEMSEPIKVFEDKCKELVDLIATTELPIKEGIQVFDDARKEAKRQYALSEIERVSKELMLDAKYLDKFVFDSKWTNLTAAEKDVSIEIYNQIELLVAKQEHYKTVVAMVNMLIDKENETLINKLNPIKFINELDSIDNIANDIKEEAQISRDNEERTRQAVEQKIKDDEERTRQILAHEIVLPMYQGEAEVIIPNEMITPINKIEVEKTFTYNMKVTGNLNNLKLLKQFMIDNSIEFKINY